MQDAFIATTLSAVTEAMCKTDSYGGNKTSLEGLCQVGARERPCRKHCAYGSDLEFLFTATRET